MSVFILIISAPVSGPLFRQFSVPSLYSQNCSDLCSLSEYPHLSIYVYSRLTVRRRLSVLSRSWKRPACRMTSSRNCRIKPRCSRPSVRRLVWRHLDDCDVISEIFNVDEKFCWNFHSNDQSVVKVFSLVATIFRVYANRFLFPERKNCTRRSGYFGRHSKFQTTHIACGMYLVEVIIPFTSFLIRRQIVRWTVLNARRYFRVCTAPVYPVFSRWICVWETRLGLSPVSE